MNDAPNTLIVLPPTHGAEASVTWPDGRVEFMGLWRLFLFSMEAFDQGYKIEVRDAARRGEVERG